MLIRKIADALGSKAVSALSNIGFAYLISKVFSIEEAGVIFFLIAASLILGVAARFGAEQILLREIPNMISNQEHKEAEKLVTGYIVRTLIFGSLLTVIFLLVFVFSLFQRETINHSHFVGVILAAPFNAALVLYGAFLKSKEQFKIASLIENGLVQLITLIVTWILVLTSLVELDVILFSMIYIAAAIFLTSTVLFSLVIKSKIKLTSQVLHFNREEVEILSVNIVAILNAQMPVVILGAFSQPALVAVYSICLRVVSVLVMFVNNVNVVFNRKMAVAFRSNQNEDVKKFYRMAFYFSSIPAVILGVCVCLFSVHILELFGSEFSTGATALSILIIGQTFSCLCGPVGFVMILISKTKIYSIISILQMFTVLILMIVAVSLSAQILVFLALISAVALASINISCSVVVFRNIKVVSPLFNILGSAR